MLLSLDRQVLGLALDNAEATEDGEGDGGSGGFEFDIDFSLDDVLNELD